MKDYITGILFVFAFFIVYLIGRGLIWIAYKRIKKITIAKEDDHYDAKLFIYFWPLILLCSPIFLMCVSMDSIFDKLNQGFNVIVKVMAYKNKKMEGR